LKTGTATTKRDAWLLDFFLVSAKTILPRNQGGKILIQICLVAYPQVLGASYEIETLILVANNLI